MYAYSYFCTTRFGSGSVSLDTIRYSISKHRFIFSFPRGSSTPDVVPKSTHLHLLYRSLLNRGCNLVYAALLPLVFSPAQDAHL